jgi:hypothetical protein
MKQIIILILLVIFHISVGVAQEKRAASENRETKPEIKFEKTIHDFGDIKYNGEGTCSFKFENTGTKPLILTKVRGDCGCIITSWPKEPIRHSEKAKIEVQYNTRIVGYFSKTIRVHSNAGNNPVSLLIKGHVEEKD